MKKIEIADKTVEVLTQLNEITVGQFNRTMVIFKQKYSTDIDQYIDIIESISNLTKDEVEDLRTDILISIIQEIQFADFSKTELKFSNEIEVHGIKYKSTATDEDYIFSAKEMSLLKKGIENSPDTYPELLAGIVFREVNEDGSIIRDYSDEGVKRRSNFFRDHLTMDIIAPYLSTLSVYLEKSKANVA